MTRASPRTTRTGILPVVRVRSLAWVFALLALCILLFTLFAPFGLRKTPWQDTWFYNAEVQAGNWLSPTPNSRPLSHAVWQTTYLLLPQSFIAMNGVIFVAMLLKGALTYGILRRLLPGQPPIAFIAMLLAVVYPAEVGYFQDLFLSVHTGFTFYLGALFLMLAVQRSRPSRRRTVMRVAALVLLALSIFTYETVQALVFATPVLFLWVEGRLSRRVVRLSVWWFVPEALYLLWLGLLLTRGPLVNREVGLVTQALGEGNALWEIVRANAWNLERQFIGAWQNTAAFFPGWRSPLTVIAAFGLVPILICFIAYMRALAQHTRPLPVRQGFGILAVGLFLTVAGYAVYSISAVRYDGWRTAFYTALGAGLCVAVALYALAEVGRRVQGRTGQWSILAAGMFALVGLATVRQLDLHRWQAEVAGWEQGVLQTIMQTAPRPAPGAVIVYRMPAEQTFPTEHFVNSIWFDSALEVVYANPSVEGVMCRVGAGAWGYHAESCTFEGDGLHYGDQFTARVYSYDRLLVFDYNADGTTTFAQAIGELPGLNPQAALAYNPLQIAGQDAPLPATYYTIFNPRPLVAR